MDAARPRVLDHASGWLLAAGVLDALVWRRDDGLGRRAGVVLARTGEWIVSLGRQAGVVDPWPVTTEDVPVGSHAASFD